jgi:hypothetical protein
MLRAVLLITLTSLLLGATAAAAQAQDDDFFVFEKVGCGTRHLQRSFNIRTTTGKVRLSVQHWPGRWGQMTVTNAAGSEVWSFRQSYAWIAGSYAIVSPSLPQGDYTVQYWSDNLAQVQSVCSGSLTQEQ